MEFSYNERKDLFYSGILISLAFAIILSGGYNILTRLNISILIAFIIAFFTAGIGFLLHELMHKYTAQSYGFRAEYRASYSMLFLAVLLSFAGFIFAAPGAVYIQGRITKEKNGKISLAGPMTNVVLAFIFLLPLIFIENQGLINLFLLYGLKINSLLAAFNMIPVAPFDGSKIITWDKKIYFISLILSIGLFLISLLI